MVHASDEVVWAWKENPTKQLIKGNTAVNLVPPLVSGAADSLVELVPHVVVPLPDCLDQLPPLPLPPFTGPA